MTALVSTGVCARCADRTLVGPLHGDRSARCVSRRGVALKFLAPIGALKRPGIFLRGLMWLERGVVEIETAPWAAVQRVLPAFPERSLTTWALQGSQKGLFDRNEQPHYRSDHSELPHNRRLVGDDHPFDCDHHWNADPQEGVQDNKLPLQLPTKGHGVNRTLLRAPTALDYLLSIISSPQPPTHPVAGRQQQALIHRRSADAARGRIAYQRGNRGVHLGRVRLLRAPRAARRFEPGRFLETLRAEAA